MRNGAPLMAKHIPDDPTVLLRRREVAAALTAMGVPITEATLATKAVRGGGPPFHSFGRIPLYRWSDVIAWATARLGAARATTAEHETAA